MNGSYRHRASKLLFSSPPPSTFLPRLFPVINIRRRPSHLSPPPSVSGHCPIFFPLFSPPFFKKFPNLRAFVHAFLSRYSRCGLYVSFSFTFQLFPSRQKFGVINRQLQIDISTSIFELLCFPPPPFSSFPLFSGGSRGSRPLR